MIAFETPLALLVVLPLLYLWWRLGRGPRSVWPIRIAILALCALALAAPAWKGRGGGRNIVFLVDRSLSVGSESVRNAAEMLDLAMRSKADDDRVAVVLFGDGATVLLGGANTPTELRSATLEDSSDLHAGLGLAGAMCTAGGRILVVSDGLYTGPDPMEFAPELHKKGTPVDFWPVRKEHPKDVAVTRVELPERVRPGEPFEVVLAVWAPLAGPAKIRVDTGEGLFEQNVSLGPGTNSYVFRHVLTRPGLARFVVTAAVADDSRPENNRAAAVTEVVGPPEVLVINPTGKPDNLAESLKAAGLPVRVAGPGTAVSSAALKGCSAVVLENVPLSQLNDRADSALRNYVTETGGGLLVTGGEQSFAAGGYYLSRLDDVLPVLMERKDEFRRARLAMAVVLDRSGSMTAPVGGGLQKMHLADRAAAEAVSLLAPQDEIAVFAIDSEAHRIVPLTAVGLNSDKIRKSILTIESMGGGIFIYVGLSAAAAELTKSAAPSRHIVLFADAADSEAPGDYRKLIETWDKAGGTISVVGMGTARDCDAELLKDIAKRGKGSITFTTDAHALPRIFCEDTMRIARKTFIPEETRSRVTSEIAQLGDLGIAAFPPVGGYNLCYTKESAAQMVVTTDENKAPVLAAWRRGLGKVAAVTCEADGPHTGKLAAWDQYKPFFSSLVKWLQKDREDPGLFGTVVREGRTASVFFEMDAAAARRCTGARALIIPPDESEPIEVPLQWASAQTMAASFRLRQNGIYHGIIVTRDGRRVALPPTVLPYSPEFQPQPPDAGIDTLKRLAESTGGAQVLHVADLFRSGTLTGEAAMPLAPALAALIVLLLLCDIVTRRALWPHVVPRLLRTGYARMRIGLAQAGRKTRERIRRLGAKRRSTPQTGRVDSAATETGTVQKPPDAPTEAQPQPATPGPNVFDRAKRRSRT